MSTIAAKWSIEEYHRMVDAGILDDRHVELLRGEIVEMVPEREPHAYCSNEAGEYLVRLLGDLAKVRYAKPITLPNGSEPEPDLAIVQRLGREYFEHHPYPANIFWLIEYANTSLEKDLETKRQIYAEVGIPEYWIVNLRTMTLIVLRAPQNGNYTTEITLSDGTIQPLAFPEVSVSVDRIING